MADGKAGNAERDARRDLDAEALFERATERPGVREVMRVHEDWKRVHPAAKVHVQRTIQPAGTVPPADRGEVADRGTHPDWR